MNCLQATRALVSHVKSKSFLVTKCVQTEYLPVRHRNSKHWRPGPKEDWNKGIYNYEWKRARGRKIAKIQLPDFDEARAESKLSPEEIRSKLKERGIVPPRNWVEKPMLIRSLGQVIDPYVPPEGDGKESMLTKAGALQKVAKLKKGGESFMSLRKIRNFLSEFDVPTFAQEALDIYIKAHQALADEDEDLLHEYVTDTIYPEMVHHTEYKTIRWQFIKCLEEPKVVRMRHQEMLEATNLFAQVTVRLHTQQTLAVYDRFGRLMFGSENVVKDVLEYVVFERHLSSEYGQWRLHRKIIPDWLPARPPIFKTYRVNVPPVDNTSSEKQEQKTEVKSDSFESGGVQPVLA